MEKILPLTCVINDSIFKQKVTVQGHTGRLNIQIGDSLLLKEVSSGNVVKGFQ